MRVFGLVKYDLTEAQGKESPFIERKEAGSSRVNGTHVQRISLGWCALAVKFVQGQLKQGCRQAWLESCVVASNAHAKNCA